MNILGISFGLHDASASLVVNGKLVSAISLERINRYKKAGGTDYRPLFYTLKAANLKLEDIDYIAITDYYQESKLPDFEITTEDDEIITGT
jgi:predicted NodU family carbamoyl transferase